MSTPPRQSAFRAGRPAPAPAVEPADGYPVAAPDSPPASPPGDRPSAQPDGHSATGANRHAATHAAPADSPAPSKKRRRLWLLLPILLIIGAVAANFGYRYWYDSTYFVMTENAQVTGDLIQVGSLNAGRIVATRVEIGDEVRQGQELAVVSIPQQVGSVAQGGTPVYGVTGNTDTLASVTAPSSGIIAARMAFAGGTTAAGQPLFALVDPRRLGVRANIEEDKVWRVQPGQAVEVHVDALNRTFPGVVEAISPASAATFSLLPSSNTSGNFTKVTQLVPIKISVNSGGTVLPLGTSVEVKIQVRQPGGGVPWQP